MSKYVLLTPTTRVRELFWRLGFEGSYEKRCPIPEGLERRCRRHHAEVTIDVYEDADAPYRQSLDLSEERKKDPRWPTHCACGYKFDSEADDWDRYVFRLYARSDGGPDTELIYAPPGAVFVDPWGVDLMIVGRDFHWHYLSEYLPDLPETSG